MKVRKIIIALLTFIAFSSMGGACTWLVHQPEEPKILRGLANEKRN